MVLVSIGLLILLVLVAPGVYFVLWGKNNNASPDWVRAFSVTAGTILLLLALGIPFAMYPVFLGARIAHDRIGCSMNIASIAKAALMYAGDNDDRLPKAANWCDALYEYCDGEMQCPLLRAQYGYSLNANASNLRMDGIVNEQDFIFAFDGPGIRNHAGGLGEVQWRHDDGAFFGFMDGHARLLRPEVVRKESWMPKKL